MKRIQGHGPHIKKITLRGEIIARLTVGELGRARGGRQDLDTSLVSCVETSPTCVKNV